MAEISRNENGRRIELTLLRNRNLWLALLVCIAVGKLFLTAVVPPSYDLRDIYFLATTQITVVPWIFVESAMIGVWKAVAHPNSIPLGWYTTSPFSMPIETRFLLLLLRFPVFASDIACLAILYRVVSVLWTAERARLASLLWFLNPYTFLAAESLAVPDIAVVFFTLLAFLLMVRGRAVFSSLALGIGVALKLYPILLVPAFLAFALTDPRHTRWAKAALVLLPLTGLGGYLAWAMPQGLSEGAMLNYDPVSQPMTALFSAIPGSRVSLVAIVLVILYYATFKFAKGKQIPLNSLVSPIFLLTYTFSDPAPQYFLWVIPFLTIDVAFGGRARRAGLTAMLSFVLAVWFMVSAGFLTPSGYSFLLFPLQGRNLPEYSVAITTFLNGSFAFLLTLVLQAALHSTTLVYAIEVFRGWFTAH